MKQMKKWAVLGLTIVTLGGMSLLTACGNSKTEKTASDTSAEESGKLKVTYITTNAGLGDGQMNDAAWAGVQRAAEDFDVEINVIEPAAQSEYGNAIVSAVNSGSDVIIGFSAAWSDAFSEYCSKFPEVYFGGMNCTAEADNLIVARPATHEISYLAGAAAAMFSKTDTVASIGGQEGVNILRFIVGFEEGAQYVNPEIRLLRSYVGSFNDPVKGKEFAVQMYREGADVIYSVANTSNEGVHELSREEEALYTFAGDGEERHLTNGKCLVYSTGANDLIAYDIIKQVSEGTFEPGYKAYDLSNGGVTFEPQAIMGEENIAKLNEIKKKIVSGEIKVTDMFEEQDGQ